MEFEFDSEDIRHSEFRLSCTSDNNFSLSRMATVTRASRKLKEEESTKGAYGLRKSVRETPSVKQKSPSILNKLRSEKQEKQTSTLAKRKSDRVEKKKKQSLPSRSERSEKWNSSSSSASKKSGKISSSVGFKNEKKSKVKRGKQTIVSGGERRRGDKQDQTLADVVSKKKRLLDARSYRALLKPPRKKAKLTDLGTRQRQDSLSEENSATEETSCSTEVGAGLDECSDKTGEEQRRKDLCSGVEEGVEGSNSGSDELADGSSRIDTEDSAECKDGNSHECNGKLGDETGGKDLEESNEDTMVFKSLGSKQIARGISVSINGDIESPSLKRKHKFCLDHRDSKFEDRTSLSRNSDGSLESSIDLITSETVDDTGTADLSYLAGGNSKDPGQNANRVFRGEDVRPLKDSDKASLREDLVPFQDCILPSLDAIQPVVAEVVLEQNDTVKAFKKKNNASDQVPKSSSVAMHAGSNQATPADPIMSFTEKNYGEFNDRCADCFKYKSCRMDLDPDKQEVCFCNATNNDSYNISLSKDREKLERSGSIVIVEDCHRITSTLGASTGSDCNACVVCKLGGKLLCCDGKGCRRSFHLSCIDPPLNDVPYGIWHCFLCVKKKLESGVHSVSEGVEYVWDSREVEVFNNEVMLKEKQYFVKFKGLAHVHNRWIRESQLVSEAPALIAKYKRSRKEQTMRWKSEWMVPQRLVQKRLLMTSKQADEYICEHGTDSLSFHYEWLVKWNGLGYEHATWEMENAQFWSLREAVELVKDYENRLEKAIKAADPSHSQAHKERKNPFNELPSLPNGCPSDNDHLSFVNKLRECWHKCQSAIVIDDQERTVVVLSFIICLRYIVYRPFLIITTATTLPVWESDLMHLEPSINSIVYSGKKNVRKFIQELEFYDKSGCVMFQVLISPIDAIIEDLDTLNCIEWEAVIVDDCQQSWVSKHYEQVRMLAKGFRLLLAGGHIKDNVHDYQNLLSFLELGDGEHSANSKSDSNDSPAALPALKERLSRYIAYERKADTSKFIEYWVPVYLSTVQLEKYCATLLSNSSCLCSYSKSDQVGALIEMLMSTRKCCDHPYLVDSSLQSMLTKGHPEVEYLDIGVNASGKLKLLDNILQEIKKRGLRVLILFQALASIGGSGRIHIGDILDDFLRQRFGPDSYERVDSGIIASKKQAAINKFNSKEMGRFVFLIESRACQPSIKLTAVDAVIIFGSDWNPLNDLRSLQRISFELHAEQLKLYRFYSTCTVEEKLLMLSKQEMSLDSNIRSVSRGTSHMLLRWGASHLFNRLDEFHGLSTPNSSSVTCEQSLLDEVVVDMLALLPQNGVEDNKLYHCSAIKRAQHSGTSYSRNISIFGELGMKSTEEEQPHVFWKKLLGGRYPQWRYWSAPSPRARKKVQYLDELPKWRESENEEARKKHKKGSNNNLNPISSKSCSDNKRKPLSSDKDAEVAVIKTVAASSSEPSSVNPMKAPVSCAPTRYLGECRSQGGNNDHDHATSSAHVIPEAYEANKIASEGRKKLRDAQRSLHLFLEPEIGKLCSTVQLPVYVKHLAKKFLEYIMNNHHVSREPVTILQAFQIALCWTAASFLKYKVDHKESLTLARRHLNFKCKDEEAESVYSKLKMLKKRFAHQMDASSTSIKPASKEDEVSAVRNDGVTPPARSSEGPASNSQDLEEGEIREYSPGNRLSTRVPVEQEQASECEKSGVGTKTDSYVNSPDINAKELDKLVKCVDKLCFQRTNEMLLKQREEIGKFIQFRERERKRLTEEHRIESDLIIRTNNDPFFRSEKLKTLDASYLKKRSDFDRRMVDWQRKIITAQQAARDKEKQIRAQWLEEARSGQLSESFSELPLPDTRLMLKKMETREQNVGNNIPDTVFSLVLPSHLNNDNSAGFKPVELAVSGKSVDVAAVMSQGIEEGISVGNSASQSTSWNAANSNVLKNITSEGQSGRDTGMHFQINSPIIAETHPSLSQSIDTSATVLKERKRDDAGFYRNSNVNKTIQDLPTVAEPQTSTSQSVYTPARVLNERTEDNASLYGQSSILNGNSHENGGLENSVSERQLEGGNKAGLCIGNATPIVRSESGRMENVGLGSRNEADNALWSSPASSLQPLQIELPTSMPTTDHNQPHTSEDMQRYGMLSSPLEEVPAQCTVDVVSSQAAPSDDNGSASQTNLLLQLDGSPVRHNQLPTSAVQSEDEPSREGCNSDQVEAPIQQPPEGLLSQTLQNNFLMSESTSAESPLPVFLDIPQREMPMATHGSSSGGIQEPSNRPPQSLTATYFQMCFAGPLQNELNKIRKEEEKATKKHEDEKTHLKAECEREIEEVHRKYNGLMLDSEMVFQQRLKELQINYSKVSKNLLLAEACRLMLSDMSKSRVAAPRQGSPFTSLVQTMPSMQYAAQQPVSAQTPVYPLQIVRHPSAFSSGNQAGPHINQTAPTLNIPIGAELRAPAPHLQPFRPTSMPGASHPLSRMPSLQRRNGVLTSQPLQPPVSVCPPMGTPSATILPNDTSSLRNFRCRSISAMDLLTDINQQSGNNLLNFPSLTQMGLSFDSLVPKTVVSGQVASTLETTCLSTGADVITVSDDD